MNNLFKFLFFCAISIFTLQSCGDDPVDDVDKCENVSCLNGGTCNANTGNCDCAAGWTGSDCGTAVVPPNTADIVPSNNANCVPPSPTDTPGLDPDSLPCVQRQVSYTQSFNIENFDSIEGIFVNSLTIDSIIGIPIGLGVNMSSTTIAGGGTACAIVSGTTTAAVGVYPMDFVITVNTTDNTVNQLANKVRISTLIQLLAGQGFDVSGIDLSFEVAVCN